MRRLGRFLLRDWPLKLAAIGLATILYAGVALSENTRTWPGPVPIEVLRPPPGGALLELPGAVTGIRYRAPLDVSTRLTNGSFRASIDLSVIEPRVGGPPVEVPVTVFPVDPRVSVVDFTPRSVNVRMDEVVTRRMPVTIDYGSVPEGIVLGPVAADPVTVVLEGASSRLTAVRSIVGQVVIDASGINIDQDVIVEPFDENGSLLAGIVVRPPTVHVSIPVARQLAYATLPVVPDVRGDPAPGMRIASVRVTPRTVTVSGEDPVIRRLTSLATEPVELGGSAADLDTEVGLVLPPEVSVVGEPVVRVEVALGPAASGGPAASP
jgi:YbbR domain-containing protein